MPIEFLNVFPDGRSADAVAQQASERKKTRGKRELFPENMGTSQ